MGSSLALVNIGTFPNDGTGDSVRTAFSKINGNFSNLEAISTLLTNVSVVSSIASANAIATPDSIVVRDASSSGYFNNLTANGVASFTHIQVNNNYILPNTAPSNAQTMAFFANGVSYWTNITQPPAFTIANSNPVINLANGAKQIITLSANVSSGNANIINPTDGLEYTFIISQGNVGGFSWNWPNNFWGGGVISAAMLNASANTFCSQKFLYSQTANIYYATSPLVSTN